MKRVLVLLAGGFEAFEAVALTDVLGWAAAFGSAPVQAVTAGFHPRLRCAFDFEVVPQARLDDLDVEA
ncbi:MAG: hypothetical protein JXO72_10805 [Vicinamibacteria bacterium]|nr:hypothetical protein [Vicinamibacteria bacterium]